MTEKITCKINGESCLKYVHPCGVTVIMYPMEGVSTCTAQFAVRFGSEDNRYRNEKGEVVTVPDGTAHYLEHKLFESEECDAFELFAQTGASCNAMTSFEYTMYYFSCTSRFERNLEILLSFVQEPYFTPENVEKERGIIGQEITMYQDNPNWLVLMELLAGVYKNNPIRNDIAGTVESISEITDKMLYDVYNVYYNPANMILTIAGNFDPDKAIEVCERCLKDKKPVKVEAVPVDEPKEVVTKRVENKMPVAKPIFFAGFKRPDVFGKEIAEECAYFNILLELMFGNISDFYQRMRAEGAINDEFCNEVLAGRGYIMPYIGGESGDPDYVLDEIKKEIRRFKSEPPSKEAFDRVKKCTYGNCIRSISNPDSAAQMLSMSSLWGNPPFYAIETSAEMNYDEMLKRLADLDEENVCLSIVKPL